MYEYFSEGSYYSHIMLGQYQKVDMAILYVYIIQTLYTIVSIVPFIHTTTTGFVVINKFIKN